MKQISVLLAIVWTMCLWSCASDKLDSIISKHSEAMGGADRWRSMTNYQHTSEKSNGTRLTMTCMMPDKITLDFEKGETQLRKGYDGFHGYLVLNGEYRSMRPGEAIEMAEEPHYYSDLIFAREKGYNLKLMDDEILDGEMCHRVVLTKHAEDQQVYWINQKTYLIEQTGEFSEDKDHDGIYYKTRLEDYREVDGLMFPHRQTLIPSDKRPITSTVSRISVDVPTITEQSFVYEPERNLITYWKDRYSDNRLKSFSFVQETVQYRSDGTVDTSTWHELVEYPDRFRIDFRERDAGNTNLFRNDSIYVFRDNKEVHRGREVQGFMVMEGSVYDSPVDSTLSRLQEIGVDTEKYYTTTHQGRHTYVIGAHPGDTTSVQIWLDRDRRNTVRRIMHTRDGSPLLVVYDDFKDFEGHDIETWLEFYLDGRLIQTERYNDVEINPEYDTGVFDPARCLDTYWY